MAATAIIPARLGSTRFPEKALAAETGTPLVVHVCERAQRAQSVERVVVATDAETISDAVQAAGFEAVMTSVDHPNGTSRIGETVEKLGLKPDAVVVNVQGDEPEIEPEIIDAAIGALGVPLNRTGLETERFASVATVASPFSPTEDPANPNIVKALAGVPDPVNQTGIGLAFTRSLAPHPRDPNGGAIPLKHVGLYAYTVRSLRGYLTLPPTPLERTESLEQLRWLEHGLTIAVAVRKSAHHGIDTPEQYAAFVERFNANS